MDISFDVYLCLLCSYSVNRHYSIPLVPDLPGLQDFKGTTVHSHDYRHPETYKDQTLLILGAASSGQDIALETAKVAKKVIDTTWSKVII